MVSPALVSGSHLFYFFLLEEYSTWFTLGDDFWRISVFSASRFDSGYMLLPVYVVVGTVSVYSGMLVLSGTCYASVYGVQEFHVFLA